VLRHAGQGCPEKPWTGVHIRRLHPEAETKKEKKEKSKEEKEKTK
jgi:hypothetical protein